MERQNDGKTERRKDEKTAHKQWFDWSQKGAILKLTTFFWYFQLKVGVESLRLNLDLATRLAFQIS